MKWLLILGYFVVAWMLYLLRHYLFPVIAAAIFLILIVYAITVLKKEEERR